MASQLKKKVTVCPSTRSTFKYLSPLMPTTTCSVVDELWSFLHSASATLTGLTYGKGLREVYQDIQKSQGAICSLVVSSFKSCLSSVYWRFRCRFIAKGIYPLAKLQRLLLDVDFNAQPATTPNVTRCRRTNRRQPGYIMSDQCFFFAAP